MFQDNATSGDPGQQFIAKAQASSLKESLTPELDPTKDLTPFERAAKDQFATAPGRDDKTPIYFGPDNIGKTNEQIVYDSFSPKLKALDAAQELIGQEAQAKEHDDILSHIDSAGVHSDINAGVNPEPRPGNGLPAPENPTGDVSSQTYGAYDPNAPRPTAPAMATPGIDSPEYQRTSDQLSTELGRRTPEAVPHELEAPNKSQLLFGLILGLSNPGSIPMIAQSMFQSADARRRFLDSMDAAKQKAAEVGHQKVISALNQRLRTFEMRDAANQRAMVSTQNNQNTNQTKIATTDKNNDARALREQVAIKAKDEWHRMSDATRNRLIDLKDPAKRMDFLVNGMHYDPDTARDIVNSEDLNRLASADKSKAQTVGITLDNTFKQKTLVTRIGEEEQKLKNLKYSGAYTQAKTKYQTELVKYLPQNEAFKWASLLALMDFRDRSLADKESGYDSKADPVVGAMEKGYNAASEQVEAIDAQLESHVDKDGNEFKDGDETDKKLKNLKRVYGELKDGAEKKLTEAQRNAEVHKAVTQEKRKRPSLFRGRPKPMQGKIPDWDASKMKPGDGEAPPVFVTPEEQVKSAGSDIIDRLLKGGGQSNSNPYLADFT